MESFYNDDFVSDRSLLDAIAYSIEHSTIGSTLIYSDLFKGYIKNFINKNNVIFKVNPQKSIMVQDGVREELSYEHMVKIDSYITFMLQANEIPYIQINTPNLQERIKLIDSILFYLK